MACAVAIIGAGVAGLYAAHCLRRAGLTDVVLLEAMLTPGGRILPYATPDGVGVDLGGEFVHGCHHNLLWDLARQQGWPLRHVFDIDDPTDLRQQAVVVHGRLLPYDSEVAKEAQDLLEWLREEKFPADFEDTSVLQYVLRHKPTASPAAVALLDCALAATWGTSLAVLGVKAAMEEEHQWVYGSGNYVLEGGCRQVVDYLKQGLDIRCRWRVSTIDYSGSEVVLTSRKGQQLRCKHLIITVPLPVLQDGDLQFTPDLPQRKLAAIRTLRMGQAGKVVCTFSRQFWTLHMILTDHLLFPQIWMYTSALDAARGLYVVTGYIAGPGLAVADQEPRDRIIALFAQYLDGIFGTPEEKVASGSLRRGMVHSWARHPTVRGAYSFPAIGSAGCRAVLAEPVGSRLFFAGEGANPRSAANMHSAMESGLAAAEAVLAVRGAAKL